MANDPSIYDTREHLDFARRMAESLLKEGNYVPDRGMATLPGTWMYGVPNIIRAISGAQYRDLAGDRESKLISNVSGKPNIPAQRYGRWAHQPPSKADMKYSGGDPDSIAEIGTPNYYIDEVKKSENAPLFSGKIAQDKSVWDYKQHSVGFGTRSKPGEVIDRAEADRRFAEEWGKAQAEVDKFKPGLPEGPRAALTSLTYNAGSQWMREGLGRAIQEGNKEKAKQYFMAYVNAGGKPNPGLKARRARELEWFDHLTDADKSKIAGAPTSEKMNLGGPPITEGENQPTNQPLGAQFAQAGGPNKPVMTTDPAVSPPVKAPQYGVPPANPVLTQDQLDATLRLAPAAERAKIMEEYQKSREGRKYETPTGNRIVTPPGQPGEQPIVTDMPSKTFPLQLKGLGLTMVPDENGQMKLMTPDGRGISSVEELNAWVRKEGAKDTASTKITEGQSDEITSAIAAGNKAPQLIKSLNTLDALSKSSDVPRGPLSKYSVAIRQVIDNLGLTKYLPNIAEADLSKAETIQKINAELARQAVQTFTNRGTNFELETYIQNNPGILQSKEGMEMLIDIIRQEYKGIQEIGKIANGIQPGDVSTFNAKIQKYYEDNPIVITGPIRDPKTNKVIDKAGKITTRVIQGEEDIQKIPSGQYFMLPSGRIGKKP